MGLGGITNAGYLLIQVAQEGSRSKSQKQQEYVKLAFQFCKKEYLGQ